MQGMQNGAICDTIWKVHLIGQNMKNYHNFIS